MDALFVNAKLAFSKDFLAYHEALTFRGGLSSRAATWAWRKILYPEGDVKERLDRDLNDGKALYLAMREFSLLGSCTSPSLLRRIVIGGEVNEASLATYSTWVHQVAYPPKDRASVKAFVMDGHAKVLTRLCKGDRVPRRTGRPRKRKGKKTKRKKLTNGWFMILHTTGRILAVRQMHDPEDNIVAIGALEEIVELYKEAKTVVYDRACKLIYKASKRSKLRRIKAYACDKLHGRKHSKKCICNPHYRKDIAKAIRRINTSVCEQALAWFRVYASIFNNMNPIRQKFYVLAYARAHNEMVSAGDTDHLNPTAKTCKIRKRPSTSYACTKAKCRST